MSTLTYEAIRADIAHLIGIDPSEIGNDDHLPDWGLDSIRIMALLQRWNDEGLTLDFAQLAEKPTLAHWWTLIVRQLEK